MLAICDLEIGTVETIIESLAAESSRPRTRGYFSYWARRASLSWWLFTRGPVPPAAAPSGTDGPRGSSHDGHTSSGDAGLEGDVSNDR